MKKKDIYLAEAATAIEDIKEDSKKGKYLTFFLEDEEYGLEILKVKEIIKFTAIVRMPKMPDYVKGIINLRGLIIPIIDLRLKFGMPPKEYGNETCIIVVHTQGHLVGIAVDTVSEVLDIMENDFEEAPNFGTSMNTDFILGMGKVKGSVKILLDIDKILMADQITSIHAAAQMAEKEEEEEKEEAHV